MVKFDQKHMHLMVKGTIAEWQFQEIIWPRSHVSVISVKTSYFFGYSIYWFSFVFSGLASRSLVSGDNSNRKRISVFKMLSKTFEYVYFSFTCERTKTVVFEYHGVLHHIPRELCMLRKGVLSYFHRFLNCVDGRKL